MRFKFLGLCQLSDITSINILCYIIFNWEGSPGLMKSTVFIETQFLRFLMQVKTEKFFISKLCKGIRYILQFIIRFCYWRIMVVVLG